MNDEAPPTSPNNLKKHTHEGSYVVNLLGELKVRSQPPDSAHFILNTEVNLQYAFPLIYFTYYTVYFV